MGQTKLSSAGIAGLIVGLAILVVVIAVPVWYATRSSASSVPTTTVGAGDKQGGEIVLRSSSLHAARFSARSTDEILAGCEGQSDDSYLCDRLPEDWFRLTEEYHFKGPVHAPERSKPQFLFVRRQAQSVVVPLENVTGKFFSAYLQFEDDMWTRGFEVDPIEHRNIQFEVQHMVDAAGNAVVLVGTEPAPQDCDLQLAHGFNALYPVTVAMNAVADRHDRLATVEGEKLRGTFRMSPSFVDYHFRVQGQDHKIRVLVTDCVGRMGDKLMFVNGRFRWLDMVTQEFTTVRNDNCLSFWNQQQFRGPAEHKAGEQEELMRTSMETAFRNQRLGMPIELLNERVDFKDLLEPGHQVQIDLVVDGHVSFYADDGFTEQALAGSLKEILMRFDIPDLNFKAKINIV